MLLGPCSRLATTSWSLRARRRIPATCWQKMQDKVGDRPQGALGSRCHGPRARERRRGHPAGSRTRSRRCRARPTSPGCSIARIEAALQAPSEQYVADIQRSLRDVSVAARANKPIGEKMIMNAAFLVSGTRRPPFDAQGQGGRRPLRQAQPPLHGALAPVQLRQHPPEARARPGVRVIILDTLLVGGIKFVLGRSPPPWKPRWPTTPCGARSSWPRRCAWSSARSPSASSAETERELLGRIRRDPRAPARARGAAGDLPGHGGRGERGG